MTEQASNTSYVSRQQDLEEPDLGSQTTAGSDLPEPETLEETKGLPHRPPGFPIAKSAFGAIVRTFQGIPPCVWVVNQHSEEITVVVSKYRPNRLLTGVDVNASSTGGGLGFSTTTYQGPATKKTLSPQKRNYEASIAVFPLWTRKDGFGVISIFVGQRKELFIENDRLEAGSTAYFKNRPDLEVVAFSKKANLPGQRHD